MNGALESALFGAAAIVIAAIVGYYASKRSAHAVDQASERQTAVEQDKNIIAATQTDLDTIRSMAQQAVNDRNAARQEREQMVTEVKQERAEMVQERAEMAQRLASLESEATSLRSRVTALEQERGQLQQDKARLIRYVEQLRDFITNLGHRPPAQQEAS